MQQQLLSAARPLPEAPPRAPGAGDLGPAKAESSARWRARRSGLTDPQGAGCSCRMTSVTATGRRALHRVAANYQAGMCEA
jgi:hypothetical protein